MPVTQCGRLYSCSFDLPTVHHVPGLALNLIFVSQLTDHGLTVTFSSTGCFVQDHLTGRRIGTGCRVGGHYHLEHLRLPASASDSICTSASIASLCSLDSWHCRLGHLFIDRLKLLSSSGSLGSVSSSSLSMCTSCRLAKHLTLPFYSSDTVFVASFDLVHSDVWGPAPSPSLSGFSYYVCFIDDYSRYTWLYLMCSHSKVFSIYS